MEILKVAGQDALKELDRLRKEHLATKQYPFIVGTDGEVKQFKDMIAPPTDGGKAILDSAAKFDTLTWLKQHAPHGGKSWPKTVAPPLETVLSLYDTTSNKLKAQINIALVEVEHPYEIFAKLGYGDWNACPAPHIHVALHKYWYEQYQSTPVAISGDIIECFVLAPPSQKSDALVLAREHYSYCYDTVEQGLGSISKLGSSLLNAKFWYFCWD